MPISAALLATTVITITMTFSGNNVDPIYSISGGHAKIEPNGEVSLVNEKKNVKLKYKIINLNGSSKAFNYTVEETLFINQYDLKPLSSYKSGEQFTYAELSSDRLSLTVCYNNNKKLAIANGYMIFLSNGAAIDPAIKNGGNPLAVSGFTEPTGPDCKRLPLAAG